MSDNKKAVSELIQSLESNLRAARSILEHHPDEGPDNEKVILRDILGRNFVADEVQSTTHSFDQFTNMHRAIVEFNNGAKMLVERKWL